MAEISVSFIVPVYNNVATLQQLYDGLCAVANQKKWTCEIVFVDDKSRDTSLDVLMLLRKNGQVQVCHLTENMGQSVALLAAMQFAQYDYLVALDADLQDDVQHIPLLVDTLLQSQVQVVFGGRAGTYEKWGRHLTAKFFKYLIYLLSHKRIPVNAGLFFAIKRNAAQKMALYAGSKPYLLSLMAKLKLDVIAVPINRQPNAFSQSGYTFWKRIKVGYKGLHSFYTCSIKPLPNGIIKKMA